MVITIKKINGRLLKVPLTKTKIINEENIINSFILKGPKKIGYISLPAFYTDWNKVGAPSCANDVAKEILKLKREDIDGLILDLRNNGGGSLRESVELAGIFIDEGPLCLQSSEKSKLSVIKDPNRGSIYDGPLVVMVNNQSASASEIFSSIMKDYKRAIIVGSKTFGKGSSQLIIPLVKYLNKLNKRKLERGEYDYIKITTSVYYDLSGKSHHGTGVKPDIMLPGIFDNIPAKNQFKIKPPKKYKQLEYKRGTALPIIALKKKNRRRLLHDKNFRLIRKLNQKINRYLFNIKESSLNRELFIEEMNRKNSLLQLAEKTLIRPSKSYKIHNNQYDKDLIQMDSYRKKHNKQMMKYIYEDIYIEKSYQVIKDYINIIE